MTLEHLHPFAGHHAIQSADFVVEWREPLAHNELVVMKEGLKPLLQEFPDFQEQLLLTVNMTQHNASHVAQQELGGYNLIKSISVAPGFARSIAINKESIQIHIGDYSRWAMVKADVLRYLGVIMPLCKRPVFSVALQYQDHFTWRDRPDSFPVNRVLNPDSIYVVKNAFSSINRWHSHHGYLQILSEPIKHRRLDNIRISRIASQSGDAIKIATSHKADFAEPYFESGDGYGSDWACAGVWEIMHDKNKEILRELLTSEVRELINIG